MLSVAEQAYKVRKLAEAGPVGKRKTSFELYDVLAQCAALAERCAKGNEFSELRALVAQQPTTQNRRYVEKGSDEYILVCRFVFGELKSSSANRSNASRYAHALREAKKQGIMSNGLAQHLSMSGGINALFLHRPLAATSVTTKTIHLTESITVAKGQEVRLVLKREPDNRFSIIECSKS